MHHAARRSHCLVGIHYLCDFDTCAWCNWGQLRTGTAHKLGVPMASVAAFVAKCQLGGLLSTEKTDPGHLHPAVAIA